MLPILFTCAVATALTAPAAGPAGDESEVEAFTEALAAVERRMEAERWDDARTLLQELVAEHGPADHVLVRSGEIRDLLRRCAFAETIEPPDPLGFVGGEVVEYSERRGDIVLRYDARSPQRPLPLGISDDALAEVDDDDRERIENVLDMLVRQQGGLRPADFEEVGATQSHPISFDGQYEVTLRGENSGGYLQLFQTPTIRVAMKGAEQMVVSLGSDASLPWGVRPYISHYDGEEWDRVELADERFFERGPYEVAVSVSRSSVSVRYNGKKVMSAPNKPRAYGSFAFSYCPEVSEIVLAGPMSGAWFDDLLDDALDERWDVFVEEYDVNALLPEWLHVRPVDDAQSALATLDACPDRTEARFAGHFAALREMYDEARPHEGLEYVDGLADAERETPFGRYMGAMFALEVGDFERAVSACDAMLDEDPDAITAAVLQARARGLLGERVAAMARLETLIEQHPTLAGPYAELANLQLLDGRPLDAKRTIERAILASIPAEALAEVNSLLIRADRGPRWDDVFEMKTTNYIVRADADDLCFAAGRVLEESLGMFERILGRVDRRDGGGPDRYPVYLFSRQKGYLDYTEDLFEFKAFNTAGLFSPQLKQLLVWNLPDRDAMLRTVRHEGFHQYLDRRVPNPPAWFNEGLAEYFETADRVRGKLEAGAINPDHVDLLGEHDSDWTPYEELIFGDRPTFYGNSTRHYAQGWAFFHYLLETERDQAQAFERLFEALVEDRPIAEAMTEAFPDEDWDALHDAVVAHVRALKKELDAERNEQRMRERKGR